MAPPDPWNTEMKLKKGQEIDPSTIRLEGVHSHESDPYKKKTKWIVPFDGNNVLASMRQKLGDVGPGKYKIKLEITGKLTDGKPFRGQGKIEVIIPSLLPP